MTYNGTTYYYIVNAQGDVTGLADSSGNILIGYLYDAWGVPSFTANDATMAPILAYINPLMYRGYVYDIESGLYYLQSRYYDPKMGRFLNADTYASTGQGLLGNNMFAYCNNNPVNSCDPTGDIPLWMITAIKGGIGAVTRVSTAYIAGEDIDELGDDLILGFVGGAFDTVGKIISIWDAITVSYEYARGTENIFIGIMMGGWSYATSLFTGENFSKLPGVVNMDESAMILFDAVFGYLSNIFAAAAVMDGPPSYVNPYTYADIDFPYDIYGATRSGVGQNSLNQFNYIN